MSDTVEVTVTPMHAEGASTATLIFDAEAELTVHDSMWTPEEGEKQYSSILEMKNTEIGTASNVSFER